MQDKIGFFEQTGKLLDKGFDWLFNDKKERKEIDKCRCGKTKERKYKMCYNCFKKRR